jgi:hypothetical protein
MCPVGASSYVPIEPEVDLGKAFALAEQLGDIMVGYSIRSSDANLDVV